MKDTYSSKKTFIQYLIESGDVSSESLEPLDEFECINLLVNDLILSNSRITAYNTDLVVKDERGKDVPVNPKKFPDKAIDIKFKVGTATVEIFLDAKSGEWDSNVNLNGKLGKLSPDLFGLFFSTNFYKLMQAKLQAEWPLTNELYSQLYAGVDNKKMSFGWAELATEDGEFDKSRIDKKNSNKDINGDGKPEYTNSGRKIVTFSDFGVKSSSFNGYCWPPEGKEFKWSTWADWKKQKPLCKMTFKHNSYNYGVSISTFDENYNNRGFRGYNLDIEPPLAWITPLECEEVMLLTLFLKFTRHCVKRIRKFIGMPTDEIYEKINNKDKCTKSDIETTKMIIRKVLKYAIKPRKVDTFSWK